MNIKKLLIMALFSGPLILNAAPLKIVASTQDLADLAQQVGGSAVVVQAITRPGEDPHFVDARPSYIKLLQNADLFILAGMDLEVGWAPVLIRSSRNPVIAAGERGYFDASKVIVPIVQKSGEISRAMGDVHPRGNPHYMLDPAAAILAGNALRTRLLELGASKSAVDASWSAFLTRLGGMLFGSGHSSSEILELAGIVHAGGFKGYEAHLNRKGKSKSGWLARFAALPRKAFAVEHEQWDYFARTFGLSQAASLEPLPGISPTTKHLGEVVVRIKQQNIPVIVNVPYYNRKYADLVAARTGVRVLELAHSVGARQGTENLYSFYEFNVSRMFEALK
ncbi:MAG: zinc ABC transporter substrate-binding protein [Spirochaetales bacterium]|nr:zinc ABC transporter substrate-binding protein [Spirochaetales bacterium]